MNQFVYHLYVSLLVSWWRGVVVTCFISSTKLLYAEPG